jgi:L-threonylcarbamoyladenylate synthase
VGIESTVLSLAGPVPTLLRPGTISMDDLRPVIGDVALPSSATNETAARPSPGMLDRHYAPRATVRIVPREDRARVLADAAESADGGKRVGALLLEDADDPRLKMIVRMPDDPAGYAARLYAALHELDDAGCDVILIDPPPDAPAWAGVRDRLRRAATS